MATCHLSSPGATLRLTRSQRRGTSIGPPGCCVWGRKEVANSYRNIPIWIDCSQVRWLTHSGGEVQPCGLKPKTALRAVFPLTPPAPSPPAKALGARGGQAVFIKRRDIGEIDDTIRQGRRARRRIGTRAYRSLAAIFSLGCFLCELCAFAVRLTGPVPIRSPASQRPGGEGEPTELLPSAEAPRCSQPRMKSEPPIGTMLQWMISSAKTML